MIILHSHTTVLSLDPFIEFSLATEEDIRYIENFRTNSLVFLCPYLQQARHLDHYLLAFRNHDRTMDDLMNYRRRVGLFNNRPFSYSEKESQSNDISQQFVEFSNVHNSDRSSNATRSNFAYKDV